MSVARDRVSPEWDGWRRAPAARAWARPVAAPLSAVWNGVTYLRNRYRDVFGGIDVPQVRVVSVGNLVVGGTGKTPMTADLASAFALRGWRVAIVSNGRAPDEVRLHREWHPDLAVYEDRDRVRGVRHAAVGGAQLVFLDDGFQHRRLARDLDLVLIAVEDPDPGRIMPLGPYREPVRELGRAHGVILTRRTATLARARERARALDRRWPGLVLGCAHLEPGAWRDIAGRPAPPPRGAVLAGAGVARPRAFAETVRRALPAGTDVRIREFPDHHGYSEDDVLRVLGEGKGRTWVVSEKDAVKLRRLPTLPQSVRVLAARFRWDWGREAVHARIDRTSGPLVGGQA